jgi:S-adenosylmethionine:tRNA ribosyltransferase-isomerase
MQLSNFDYHLPTALIAQTPAEPRDSAKLLCLNRQSGQIEDKIFRDIASMLWENDVLVVNETKVINARLRGYKVPVPNGTGTECEIFLHKQLSENTWDCLVYPGKKLKPGAKVLFPSPSGRGVRGEGLHKKGKIWDIVMEWKIIGISEKWRIIEFSESGQAFLDIIDKIGETPLPPYIKDHSSSSDRYQTVYHDEKKSGSVAAPTAGLHFTPELLETLKAKWVQIEKVCLHVGLGTFANVEVENIRDHHMHSEQIYISPEVSERLNFAKKFGKRIIAVGTTSVRTLESFSDEHGQLGQGQKDTEIFIYPGYQWKFVDSIITNFHLPKSTLLMLVSSFAGDENRKRAYQHAVDSQYRFFSFWDAMFIS